jgi:hypothetical protein
MIIFTAVVAVPRLDALAAVQDELSRVALPVGRVGLLLVKAGVKVGQRGGAKVGQWMAMQLLSISWGRASGA